MAHEFSDIVIIFRISFNANWREEKQTQMLVIHIVSSTPVSTVCQVLQPLHTNLNKENQSKSLPQQVYDSSTCVKLLSILISG